MMFNTGKVFFAYAEHTGLHVLSRKILMVKHSDDQGSWYLPGGKYPYGYKDMNRSMNRWFERQTSLGQTDVQYLAHWKEEDGTVSRLCTSRKKIEGRIGVPSGSNKGYVSAVQWKTHEQVIAQHEKGLTPWEQFKMAIYGLDPHLYVMYNEASKGGSFTDEFRAHDGSVWTHPDFR